MMKKIGTMLLSASVMLGMSGGLLPAAQAADDAPKQPELKTRYTAPATDWESQALPIGNGFIGGMVFGDVDNDHIQVNEHSLWSGGPGSTSHYNFGINTDSAEAKQSLQQLRQKLQDLCSDFTANHAAHKEGETVVAEDYGYGSAAAEIAQLQKALYGDRSTFGNYQTLGDIYLTDPSQDIPLLQSATSTAEPVTAGQGETADKLFDGNSGSKWFAGNTGTAITYPVTVSWQYTAPYALSGYQMVSAGDVEGRDPADWTLYGSDNGDDWTALDTQSGVRFNGRGETQSFALAKSARHRFFKLEIAATREGLPPQLAEIVLTEPETTVSYTDYERGIDLNTGMAVVSYQQDGVSYTREYFASYPDNVMVIRLTADQKASLSRRIRLSSEQTVKTITAEGDTLTMTGQPADQKPSGLHFAEQVKVIPVGGRMTVEDDTVLVEDADELLLIMAAATNYVQVTDGSQAYFSDTSPLDTVKSRIAAAATKGYDALKSAHIADYTALFDRVSLDVGGTATDKPTDRLLAEYQNGNTAAEDRYLETLYYQFGRYLLIASSRKGSLPANLQGIWATGLNPPWNADYHTNINLQMNYWPAESTNLSECHEPLIAYIRSLVKTGELYAQYYYTRQDGGDVRGWAVACGCNIWNCVGSNDSEIGLVPSGAAWLCQDIWEHYQFTLDEDFLAENYDVMLGAALFWVDNLWEDERDGTLVVNPSYSPENGSLSLGTTYDQSIVWEIFQSVLKAADVLDRQSSELEEIRTALNRLSSPLRVGLAGQFMEWKDETRADITGSGQHRHVSQLFGLHPGSLVVVGRSDEDDSYIEAMKTTLRLRGDGGTGWSKAWKINFWARLRDGDHAGVMVNQILKESTLPNLFDTHPPFQIDGNFGATAGMTEMLLQSQGDSIDLLAALPSMWANGSVTGLKARGNFTIDMAWEGQQLQSAAITSVAGADCTVNYTAISKATVTRLSDGKAVAFTKNDNDTITFATEAGETYVFSEIPQEKKLPDLRTMAGANFNNLYSDALVKTTGCPDNNGAYIDSFIEMSGLPKSGLMVNDVVRAFNGTEIVNTKQLSELYGALEDGDEITLKVWRGTGEFEVTFCKYEEQPVYYALPSTLQVSGNDMLYDATIAKEGDSLSYASGDGGMVGFSFVQATRPVTSCTAKVQSTKGGQLTVYLDVPYDSPIATIKIPAGADWQNVKAAVSGFPADYDHTVYVEITGDVKLASITFACGDVTYGDVDANGKVDSSDARMVLQASVNKIELTDTQKAAADVDGNAVVDSSDARAILQKSVNKIDQFPVEQ